MNRSISSGQAAACIFLALLAPMIRVLPGAAARLGGGLCWLGAIPAFAAVAAYLCFLLYFLRRDDRGLGALFLRCLGPAAGRGALLLYAGAFLLDAGFILRVGADRLIVTVYPDSGPAVFYTLMLLLCLLSAMGKLRALAQAAVIFRALLLAVLILALLSGAKEMDVSLLRGDGTGGLADVLAASLPMINIGIFSASFGFLAAYVPPEEKRPAAYLPWLAATMLLCAALCAAVTGSFGPRLTGQLLYPFFVFVRDLSFFNLGSRIEALVVAMWVFSDYVLCVLLLRSAHEALRPVFSLPAPEDKPLLSLRGERWMLPAEGLCVWLVARFIAPNEAVLQLWSDRIIPLLFAGLMLPGLLTVFLIGRLRKKI